MCRPTLISRWKRQLVPAVYGNAASAWYPEPARTSIAPSGLNRTIAASWGNHDAGPALKPSTASIGLALGVAVSSTANACVCAGNAWLVHSSPSAAATLHASSAAACDPTARSDLDCGLHATTLVVTTPHRRIENDREIRTPDMTPPYRQMKFREQQELIPGNTRHSIANTRALRRRQPASRGQLTSSQWRQPPS